MARPKRSAIERLLERIITTDDDCWIYTGEINWAGYGRIYDHVTGGKRVAHRVAYEAFVGSVADGLDLDHACRRRACVNPKHLRPANRSQNNANAGPRASHAKGISFHKSAGLWHARIKVGGTTRDLGYFRNPDDAARAYDSAALHEHGDFALTNFPREEYQ